MVSDRERRGRRSDDRVVDLLDFFLRNGLILLGGVVLGAAVAVGASFTLTPEYDVQTSVRIGQIGGREPVERPSRVLERVRSGRFKDSVAEAAGLSPEERSGWGFVFAESLRMRAVEQADVIAFQFRAPCPEVGIRLSTAIVEQLQGVHAPIAKPSIERLNSRLADVVTQLARAQEEQKRIEERILRDAGRARTSGDFSERVLLADIILKRENEIRTLRDQRLALEEQLSPERTYPTSMLEQPSVSKQPVFPKRSMFAVGGALIGFLLATVVALRTGR